MNKNDKLFPLVGSDTDNSLNGVAVCISLVGVIVGNTCVGGDVDVKVTVGTSVFVGVGDDVAVGRGVRVERGVAVLVTVGVALAG